MTKFKRFVSAFLGICMMFAVLIMNTSAVDLPSTETAVENVPSLSTEEEIREFLLTSPTTVWKSEYDIVKDLQAQIAYNQCNTLSNDIQETVANIDCAKRLYELQGKGEDFLRENGYPEEQINAIMDFDGSEAAISVHLHQ